MIHGKIDIEITNVPVRVHISRKSKPLRFLLHPAARVFIGLCLTFFCLGLAVLAYYYVRYSRLIDQKLRAGPFQTTSMIFASPRVVTLGDEVSPQEIVEQLRRSGYTESRTNVLGWYHVRKDAIEIFPGPDSYFDQEAGIIKFAGDRIVQIISGRDNTERTEYMLEPELITNLFDRNRVKRRLVKYQDLPKVLVEAVISAEDKRFFQHSGFDPLRIIKAAYTDLVERRMEQGASTLSMQLARNFWLDRRKTWRRKVAEVLITLQLEQRLTKEQIFEYYANEVDLGRRGSFSIRGFGEAAQAYFGKDVRDLTLPEAATLAGLIQRPSYFNPYRWPERARQRRNIVLGLMRENGYITEKEYIDACAAPLVLVRGGPESTDAPYFVDLVNDELQDRFQDRDFQSKSYRVYTTLDLDLQRAAAEAVRIGLQEVDEQINRRRRRRLDTPEAQVALIALDPKTGEVKALIGGRNYGLSQLNRALAKRQPGSSFKPFVYAAAFEASVAGTIKPITPLTTVVDEPTTFWFDGKPYQPANFKEEYLGVVTLRTALAKSKNVPTVRVAEMVGYQNVVDLATRAGMNLHIQPTPAVALGAYEVTPLEVAGAYTIFANSGIYSKPYWVKLVRDDRGEVIYTQKPIQRQVLDARVAYLMVDLLQEVLRTGTGAGVRARGFSLPACGKTGTSFDGWFAGFTSNLLCVVWVGFDNNEELKLEGAKSALPIWTEFMKRAHQLRQYRNVKPFEAPDGIVTVEIDPETNALATTNCPKRQMEAFIAGTEPVEVCPLHGGALASATQVTGWESEPSGAVGSEAKVQPRAEAEKVRTDARRAIVPVAQPVASGTGNNAAPKPKKGFFRRLLDVFK